MGGLGIPRAISAVRISLVTTCRPSGFGLPDVTRWCPHAMGKPSCFFLGLLDNVGTCWKTKFFFFWENHSEMFDNVGKSENVWIFMLKMFDPQAHEISFKLIYIYTYYLKLS